MAYAQVTENEIITTLKENRDEIAGFEFQEINFTELELKSRVFLDCKFTKCNLSNVSLMNIVFRGVVFEDCNLMGTNWVEVRKGGDYSFNACKMDYCCFQGVDLRNMKFDDCLLREADFSSANLSKASFKGANLSGTSFANVNIEKADFRGARSYFIDPRFAKIKEAKFSFPEALVLVQAMGAEVEF